MRDDINPASGAIPFDSLLKSRAYKYNKQLLRSAQPDDHTQPCDGRGNVQMHTLISTMQFYIHNCMLT